MGPACLPLSVCACACACLLLSLAVSLSLSQYISLSLSPSLTIYSIFSLFSFYSPFLYSQFSHIHSYSIFSFSPFSLFPFSAFLFLSSLVFRSGLQFSICRFGPFVGRSWLIRSLSCLVRSFDTVSTVYLSTDLKYEGLNDLSYLSGLSDLVHLFTSRL